MYLDGLVQDYSNWVTTVSWLAMDVIPGSVPMTVCCLADGYGPPLTVECNIAWRSTVQHVQGSPWYTAKLQGQPKSHHNKL